MSDASISECIWCNQIKKDSLEHLFPDALGCPKDFVLESGVCVDCNNGLAHLDQALVHEFEMIAFMLGIKRKGERPPVVDSWAPLAAKVTSQGPEVHINAGPNPVKAFGKTLPAANAGHGIKKVNFQKQGAMGKVTFEQELGKGPKFVRALYKVALGSIAFHHGLDAARSPIYDSVRTFVNEGKGAFRALMLHVHDEPHHGFPAPVLSPTSGFPLVPITIFGLHMFVDLDPEQKSLMGLKAAAEKEGGYVLLPPE